MSQSTPLRGLTSSSAHFRPEIGSDTICHIPGRSTTVARYCPLWAYHSLTVFNFSGPLRGLTSSSAHFRPEIGSDTICHIPSRSTTVARYCPLWAYHSLTWVTHPGSALASFSLNFGVPMEPEASELPKGLVLGRDENIHLRILPLGEVFF
ncbi:hypothetical protein DVH24_000442 [Malus domestica]|uniref:Uncharacterized protein n=1 Tax=Malus domestica TaxID=3750 RepID=A0A498J4Q5_MALDO|nr:hypothetical protein DVH24_000442 [Malus domestica]